MRKFFSGFVLLTEALIYTASEVILFIAGAKVALIAVGVIYLVVSKV